MAYCEDLRNNGKLHHGTTMNECALFVGQYMIIFGIGAVAIIVPFKLVYSYILFKYAHQLVAGYELVQEREETIKKAQQANQQ